MTLRLSASLLVAACLAVSCAPAPDAEAAADPAAEMAADLAAIEQVRADYVTHYNLHHADMVADLFTDSAVFLAADQNVHMGKAAILASLTEEMAGSPAAEITTGNSMVMGDKGVAYGSYAVTSTPEGAAAMSLKGNYMTVFGRVDGAWKIEALITNFDGPPPEGFPFAEAMSEPPPEEGTMGELIGAYTTHFNQGHADMTAALFTEDATAAFAGRPAVTGRSAIEAAFAERFAAGPMTLEMHDVATTPLGEGWVVDGGWYTLNATRDGSAVVQSGAYLTLARQEADGSWKIHWSVSNGKVEPATK